MHPNGKDAAAASARQHATLLRSRLGITGTPRIAIVLGTGWGDALALEDARSIAMTDLPGFAGLGALAGHQRRVETGTLDGIEVVLLRGRVHLNEHPSDPALPLMVRLQIEMLLALGVTTLVLTAGVGGLGTGVRAGDLVVIDGFITLFAPPLPLFAGEFEEADTVLDQELRRIALTTDDGDLPRQGGGYAMLRGPNFESRRYDKRLLRAFGARVVGMSVLPEACVAMLHPGTRVLALGYVTNDDVEEHSHEKNVGRAKDEGEKLGQYLTEVIRRIGET
jgi:purine-nucleoside phosphorylase